uniref:Uncharacterized protein n=1 Tax=Sphaeramia orbicularis TaxID=375764 RepID=A0A673AUD7_9TELE
MADHLHPNFSVSLTSSQQVTCGGLGPIEEVTEGLEILCYQVKTNHCCFLYPFLETPTYICTGSFLSVLVGEEKCVHMKVYWTLPCCGGGAVLVEEQENQTQTEPIQPLEYLCHFFT